MNASKFIKIHLKAYFSGRAFAIKKLNKEIKMHCEKHARLPSSLLLKVNFLFNTTVLQVAQLYLKF